MNAENATESQNRNLDTPKVGDGATFRVWSDCHACTVVAVSKSGLKVTLQRDTATLLNRHGSGEPDALQFEPGGFVGHTSGVQRYRYEPNPNGSLIVVSRRVLKNGQVVWKQVGCSTNVQGAVATFGVRREHYDYNF
jgi:hypothetical protein